MIVLYLFLTFFKIGLFTIGGGYAMIPMIQQDILSHGWVSQSDLIDFIAISESTPGPFAINIATFVGMSKAGLIGAVSATLGVVLPSFLIILIIAKFFAHFQDHKYVKAALYGLRPAVVGLIAAAALSIFTSVALGGISPRALLYFRGMPSISWRAVLIVLIVFLISRWRKKLHPIWLIAISGAFGFLFHAFLQALH